MGRSHAITLTETATPSRTRDYARLRRVAERGSAVVLLLLSAPIFLVSALLVRCSSHGPVLARDLVRHPGGVTVELLSFRTTLDGGGTVSHARLRAVVGGGDPATSVGRQLVRLRLDRLPRLINVARGEASLLGGR